MTNNEHGLQFDTEQKNTVANVGKLAIERLYIKEQSCKVPYAPSIYQQKDVKPETNLELNIKHYPQQENRFEVVMTLNITMKLNQQTAFTMEVQHAGLFHIEGFDKQQEAYLLGAYCPNIIFPYARKVVSDLYLGAGFSPAPLPPINFDSLYQQRIQQDAQNKTTTVDSGSSLADTLSSEKITIN